jgi:hypothetical protein
MRWDVHAQLSIYKWRRLNEYRSTTEMPTVLEAITKQQFVYSRETWKGVIVVILQLLATGSLEKDQAAQRDRVTCIHPK